MKTTIILFLFLFTSIAWGQTFKVRGGYFVNGNFVPMISPEDTACNPPCRRFKFISILRGDSVKSKPADKYPVQADKIIPDMQTSNAHSDAPTPKEKLYYRTNSTVAQKIKWADSLCAWYDEYFRECYADSSQKCVNVWRIENSEWQTPCSSSDIDLGISPYYRDTKQIWIHKEPTFPGFIEYLKGKK